VGSSVFQWELLRLLLASCVDKVSRALVGLLFVSRNQLQCLQVNLQVSLPRHQRVLQANLLVCPHHNLLPSLLRSPVDSPVNSPVDSPADSLPRNQVDSRVDSRVDSQLQCRLPRCQRRSLPRSLPHSLPRSLHLNLRYPLDSPHRFQAHSLRRTLLECLQGSLLGNLHHRLLDGRQVSLAHLRWHRLVRHCTPELSSRPAQD